MFKKIGVTLLLMISMFSIHLSTASAVSLWGSDTLRGNIQTQTGLGNTDPREMVASVIKILLGFLGIIAVVLILYAGFLWMTAGGDSKNVDSAKNILKAAVIGLIIILMSYAIANMVLTQISTATNLSTT